MDSSPRSWRGGPAGRSLALTGGRRTCDRIARHDPAPRRRRPLRRHPHRARWRLRHGGRVGGLEVLHRRPDADALRLPDVRTEVGARSTRARRRLPRPRLRRGHLRAPVRPRRAGGEARPLPARAQRRNHADLPPSTAARSPPRPCSSATGAPRRTGPAAPRSGAPAPPLEARRRPRQPDPGPRRRPTLYAWVRSGADGCAHAYDGPPGYLHLDVDGARPHPARPPRRRRSLGRDLFGDSDRPLHAMPSACAPPPPQHGAGGDVVPCGRRLARRSRSLAQAPPGGGAGACALELCPLLSADGGWWPARRCYLPAQNDRPDPRAKDRAPVAPGMRILTFGIEVADVGQSRRDRRGAGRTGSPPSTTRRPTLLTRSAPRSQVEGGDRNRHSGTPSPLAGSLHAALRRRPDSVPGRDPPPTGPTTREIVTELPDIPALHHLTNRQPRASRRSCPSSRPWLRSPARSATLRQPTSDLPPSRGTTPRPLKGGA